MPMVPLKILRKISSFQISHPFRSMSFLSIFSSAHHCFLHWQIIPNSSDFFEGLVILPLSQHSSWFAAVWNIDNISDELIVNSMELYLTVLQLLASRECKGPINIYNHHIVYENRFDKLVCWFMLQFSCQKSLLMLVADRSAKLVKMLENHFSQAVSRLYLLSAINALSLLKCD